MTLRLNGSTSGYTELDAPAVAGNNNIKLPAGNGSAYQIVRNGAVAGQLEYADAVTLDTVNAGGTNPFPSTGGPTAVEFTAIPSWVSKITVILSGVSISGTDLIQIQLGSGSFATSGYLSGATTFASGSTNAANSTTGMIIQGSGTASLVIHGIATLARIAGNTWVMSFSGGTSEAGRTLLGGGSIALGGTLDRLRVKTDGTNTFDAGSINIMYE